jgi:hypothetical protein
MNRKIFKSILGIVALSATFAANAAVVNLSTSPTGPILNIGDTGLVPTTTVSSGASFTDNFYFSLASSSQLSSNVTNIALAAFGFANLNAQLYDTSTGNTLVGSGLQFTLPSLAGGDNYKLVVFGDATSPLGGIFSGAVHVSSAVPIPAAAWLLLSGLVGVGTMARRRKSEVMA